MSTLLLQPWQRSAGGEAPLRGHTTARIFTPPLRELTPDTSYGYAVVDFARDVLHQPLDPWQEWLVIRMGELLPDGRPRFRQVLILVARQNGKTHLLKVLALFWVFIEQWPLTLGTSTNLDYAREAWEKAVELAEDTPALAACIARNGVRKANGEQQLTSTDRCRYKIAASNRRGGRSLSIDRLIADELREQQDWSAYKAAVPAMNARPYGQAVFISNQGDDTSVVLDSLHAAALEYITEGTGDPRLGLFEWSAPEGSDVMDEQAWAAANPNLGHRLDPDSIRGPAQRARAAGGEEESGFKTEVLCMRVRSLDPAIDPAAWTACLDPGTLADARSRAALCLDVSLDRMHATLCVAAVLEDGRTRVETVAAWSGPDATQQLRAELPALVRKVRPQVFGWIPSGPAAALAADLADRRKAGRRVGWPPAGVTVAEITAEVTAVCMGMSEQVRVRQVAHSGEPLLDAHLTSAGKLWQGDRWRFQRRGDGHCDAAYAAAGAVHLARTLPSAVGKPRLVTVS